MLDNADDLFTVTDLKQYQYCPRIFYYHACLPAIRPTTFKMEMGIQVHQGEPKRAVRRTPGDESILERWFDVPVQSTTLGLSGQIDEVIQTPTGWFPIDYKLAKKVGTHFKLQVAAYAMLLEEQIQQPVKKAMIYLIPLRRTEQISITPKLRQEVQNALATMQRIAERETMPPLTEWQQRCFDCEFRRFCNDV